MTNSTLIKVYNNIKKYRTEKNISQNVLAEMTNLSVDYISLIENGKRTPSLKSLCKIADALEIEAYKFLL